MFYLSSTRWRVRLPLPAVRRPRGLPRLQLGRGRGAVRVSRMRGGRGQVRGGQRVHQGAIQTRLQQ